VVEVPKDPVVRRIVDHKVAEVPKGPAVRRTVDHKVAGVPKGPVVRRIVDHKVVMPYMEDTMAESSKDLVVANTGDIPIVKHGDFFSHHVHSLQHFH
jgi:hypothetical protein